jgi:CBS domain-containing protein
MSDKQDVARPRRADYERALESMDTFMDISIDDLMTLSRRAEVFSKRRMTERLTVAQIMSKPVFFVHPETAMSEAAHLMVKKRISGLPVVGHDQRLVGIITEADFLRGLGVPAHHPTHNLWQTLELLLGHLNHHAELEAPDDHVASYMERDVICSSPDHDLQKALELMKKHKVKRLIVCDEAGRVIGMVTRSDLMQIFFDHYSKK